MRKIKVVVLLVQQLQHGFTKNAKVSPNLTVVHLLYYPLCLLLPQSKYTDRRSYIANLHYFHPPSDHPVLNLGT